VSSNCHFNVILLSFLILFVCIQVVMKEGQTIEEGQRIAEDLMSKLGINKEDLIEGAYMDLLLKNKPSQG